MTEVIVFPTMFILPTIFATNIYAHKFVRMWSGTIGDVLKRHM
jgi:hypothetical protein